METAGPGPARDTGPGSRRIFTLGLAVFGAASAACGLAPTLSVLVAARLLPAPQPRPRAVDLGGQVLAITGLGALLAGDERAPREFETGLWGQSGPVPNPE